MSSYRGPTTSKSRATKVKPILKKLTQAEKNSLDLDRPAAEQHGLGIYDYGTGSRSVHDVAVNHAGRRGYHNRSTSGTSQFSTATTSSGQKAGSFVHPFQQTPRPYTPPLIAAPYQNPLRESEPSNSPAAPEDEEQLRQNHLRSTPTLSNHTPSLTSIASPIIAQPSLRIQTKQSSSSRLALAASRTSLEDHLSPLSPNIISPVETMTPVSAIRTSIDKGFRIRSRSEADSRYRAEDIQAARRKWMEREQAKEEKVAREEIRQMEKRNQKEARQIERGHRRSSASEHTRAKRSKSDLTMQSEKGGPLGRDYSTTASQGPPSTALGAQGADEMPGRSRTSTATAKKKTHSAWTKFMMWFRTRFIRLGKKRTTS